MRLRALLLGYCLLAIGAPAQTVGDPIAFYANRIKPLLSSRCYACHTQAAMGGLRLDSREAFVKGGKSGSALAMLLPAVTHTHPKIKMPPGGKLSDAEIADLRQWLESGAHFDSAAAPQEKSFDVEGRRICWSFVAPVKQAPPPVKDAE